MNKSAAIIGCGAAGLMASSILGPEAFVLEHGDEGGKKLLITGGGRCNYTSSDSMEMLSSRYYEKKNFVSPALHTFPPEKITAYFETLGIKSTVEENGKVFPSSGKAREIRDALLDKTDSVIYGEKITGIKKSGGIFHIETERKVYTAEFIIIATGGITFPETGSDGSLNKIIRGLGHKIIAQHGTLTEIMTPTLPLFKAEGISLTLTLKKGKTKVHGDAVITKRGISGPAPENFSHYLETKDEATIEFLPLTRESFSSLNAKAALKNALPLPERLTAVLLPDLSGKRVSDLSNKEKDEVIHALSGNIVPIKLNERRAMCTKGGVATDEVNRRTMESRLVENLYFAGEVLDVDGECGGYNLTWAFASAFTAASEIRKKKKLVLS